MTIPADALGRLLARTQDLPRLESRADAIDPPLSVLYGGAHLFSDATFEKLGKIAARAFAEHIRNDDDVCAVTSERARPFAGEIRARVSEKLARSPLEDVRIDFEDGYGVRSAEDEDRDADRVGEVLAKAGPAAPRWVGIRVKAFDRHTCARAARTLTRVLESLGPDTLPKGFVVTLPKVRRAHDVRAFVELLGLVEADRGLPRGAIGLELMIETPEALFTDAGNVAYPSLLEAGNGRVTSLHLGAYDLLSLCDVGATAQALDHPICTMARSLMVLAVGGRGGKVRVVDGATTRLPLPIHRDGSRHAPLGDTAIRENHDAILDALRAHAKNVDSALRVGIHQGWDLHPAQLAARYMATSAYYLEALEASAARLQGFVAQAARATALGQTFDDAATAEGLLAFFTRGLGSGMLLERDVAATGLTIAELGRRTFDV